MERGRAGQLEWEGTIVHRPKRKLYYKIIPDLQSYDELLEKLDQSWMDLFNQIPDKYDCAGIIKMPYNWKEKHGFQYAVGVEASIGYGGWVPDGVQTLSRLAPCDLLMMECEGDVMAPYEVMHPLSAKLKQSYSLKEAGYELADELEPSILYFDKKQGRVRFCFPIDKIQKSRISDEEKMNSMTKEELYRLAYYDILTGYHNWTWLWERLDRYQSEGIEEYAFVHFDIKDYKMVNEIYGHEQGNELLRQICRAIDRCGDWVYYAARCDNDNFAMMTHVMPEDELREKLTALFAEIATLDCDSNYHVYYRCGVAMVENTMPGIDMVADLAKMAQRLGQKHNRTEIHFYTEQMHDEQIRGKHLKAYLDKAIEQDEFLVYFQPKYNIHTEKIVGAEALVRWNYKHTELMYPNRFIPYFETDDSIGKVDQVVLKKVCSKLQEWKRRGIPLYPVSVNLSRRQLDSTNLVETLVRIVSAYDVDFSMIEFELTESAAYGDKDYLLRTMCQLRDKGFQLSMDDFGMGYSSLSLLKDMPLSTLKIDKSFVDGIMNATQKKKEHLIVQDIIHMTNHLEIKCLAEGAEYKEQIDKLKEWGCEYIQGYYFSKPVKADEYERMVLEQGYIEAKETIRRTMNAEQTK